MHFTAGAHKSLRTSLLSFSLLLAGLLSALPTPRAVAATGALQAVKAAGKLVVAIDTTYPPMEMEGDDGKPAGFDVDLARELGKRLGVKVEFVVMPWDGIIAGLAAKRYDIICSAMNITPERQRAVAFVEYLKMSQVYVGKKGSTVVKEADLAGKVVAVQADTTSSAYVEKVKKNGVAIKDLKAFKGATDVFNAVRSNQAEAVVIDEPVAKYYVKKDPKNFVITGRALAPEAIGIALRKDDKDLQKEVARLIDAMRADGTLHKLQVSYFGGELGT